MKSDEIKQFYNSFLQSRMVNYRLSNGNERINLATRFILNNIEPYYNILEIGCGIGIITERISKILKSGFIWACDISDQNIWYSKKSIHQKNIDFFVVDIIEQFEIIKESVNKPINAFLFVDVLEHIPKEKHLDLFTKLKTIAANDAKIFLTFPSEYYQEYLIQKNPKELQIIDEIITLAHIVKLSEACDYTVKKFELKDVWMTNQYVHCMLTKKNAIINLDNSNSLTVFKRLWNRIKYYYSKRKYIDNVFKEN